LDNTCQTLIRACEPSLKNILRETVQQQLALPFGETIATDQKLTGFISLKEFSFLPVRVQKAIDQALTLLGFLENKQDISFSPVFTPLLGPLDEAAKALLIKKLGDSVPDDKKKQYDFFKPDLSSLMAYEINTLQKFGDNLKRTLIDNNGLMPIGLLRWCLEYTKKSQGNAGGVFQAVRTCFADLIKTDVFETIELIYRFRNEFIAHQEKELQDKKTTYDNLRVWVSGLKMLCEQLG